MRRVILLVSALFLLGAIALTQDHLTELRGSEPKPESLAFIPATDRVKPYLLGYHHTFAHYLWIRTVLYFGSRLMTDQSFPWLIEMLDIITRLHPHFYPAFEFAGLLVPEICDNPDAARIILERGMIHLGDKRWNIPFYLGMLYYRHYDDVERAAQLFSLATMVPGAPSEKLATLAASFFQRSGKDEVGLELLYFLYETSDNPEVKNHLYERITAYIGESKQ